MIPLCYDNDGFKKTRNYIQLMKTVVEYSKCSQIDIATAEWYIISRYKEEGGVECLCGHYPCNDLFVIKNYYNHNELAPIGNQCMKYFQWNEQDKKILEAFKKWHYKEYQMPASKYYKVAFHEIIKDVEYIRTLETQVKSAEQKRLLEYAHAVWVHKPPPPPPTQPPPIVCGKCVIAKKKGYKMCYECRFGKSDNAIEVECKLCVVAKKKGYKKCYICFQESQR